MANQVQENDISVKSKTKRIVALDIIRGWFLMVILINHIEFYPNGFDYLTGRGRLFVSAAEGFFFMSGLLIGMVYKRRLQLGMKFIFTKMWKRAAQLYVGSVVTTLLFAYWAVATNHAGIKFGLPQPMDWHWVVKETLLMRYGFGWADFLMRFAILMIFAPFVFYLLAKRKWWLALAGMLVIWAFRGQNFTLSWQLIFYGSAIIGFYWENINDVYQRLKPKTKHILKVAIAAVTAISFIYSYLSVYLQSYFNRVLSSLPHWLQTFTIKWNYFNDWIWRYDQKWNLGPLRIFLFLCWFAVMFAVVNKHHRRINRVSRRIFELMGRNSLYVYIAHAFIVFIIKYFVPWPTEFWKNFVFTALAIVLLIAATVVYTLLTTNPFPKSLAAAKALLLKSRGLLSGNS